MNLTPEERYKIAVWLDECKQLIIDRLNAEGHPVTKDDFELIFRHGPIDVSWYNIKDEDG